MSSRAIRYGGLDGSYVDGCVQDVTSFVLGMDAKTRVGVSNERMLDVVTPLTGEWNTHSAPILVFIPGTDHKFKMDLGDILVNDGVNWGVVRSIDFGFTEKNVETDFKKELTSLLNRYSIDSDSNTADFILADFVIETLASYGSAVDRSNRWHKGGVLR